MIEKVYVTKYALTDGVRLYEVEKLWSSAVSGREYAVVVGHYGAYELGKDAHVTIADAEKAFEKMRASAIKSAEKKLEKLRSMKFEAKE